MSKDQLTIPFVIVRDGDAFHLAIQNNDFVFKDGTREENREAAFTKAKEILALHNCELKFAVGVESKDKIH